MLKKTAMVFWGDIVDKLFLKMGSKWPSSNSPQKETHQIAKFIGPTWGPPGSCRPQMGPMLAPWTLLSGSSLNLTSELSPGVYFNHPRSRDWHWYFLMCFIPTEADCIAFLLFHCLYITNVSFFNVLNQFEYINTKSSQKLPFSFKSKRIGCYLKASLTD